MKTSQKFNMTTFASAMLPIRRGDVWMSHLSGTWATQLKT